MEDDENVSCTQNTKIGETHMYNVLMNQILYMRSRQPVQTIGLDTMKGLTLCLFDRDFNNNYLFHQCTKSSKYKQL